MALFQTLTDDFNGGSLDLVKWQTLLSGGATITQSLGHLGFATAAGSSSAQLISNSTYDLTSSYALAEVSGLSAGVAFSYFNMSVSDSGFNNGMVFEITNGSITAYCYTPSTDVAVATATYSSTTHRWLRIRESGGTVFWDVSPDGLTWTNFASSAPPSAVTAMLVDIYILTSSSLGVKTAVVDNFNIPNLQTPRTQTGKANVIAPTLRTQTGVASIANTADVRVYEQALWGNAFAGGSFWGDSPFSYITTTLRTQAGKARITVAQPRTQTGVARVTATTSRTQLGKSRVTATTTRTNTGKARITVSTARTQLGKSRITVATPKTQTGKARITASTLRTQTGKGNIANKTLRTQTGVATIIGGTSRTQTGVANIRNNTLKVQTGVARIVQTVLKTQTGVANIVPVSSTTRSQTGHSRITVTVLRTQMGRAAVQILTTKTITGKSRITLVTSRLQLGKARIQKQVGRIQTGVARIVRPYFRHGPNLAAPGVPKPRLLDPGRQTPDIARPGMPDPRMVQNNDQSPHFANPDKPRPRMN